MADVHIIDTLSCETWSHLLSLLLEIEDYWQEAFDVGGRDVVAVGALDQGFALEVEDGDEGSHLGAWSSLKFKRRGQL